MLRFGDINSNNWMSVSSRWCTLLVIMLWIGIESVSPQPDPRALETQTSQFIANIIQGARVHPHERSLPTVHVVEPVGMSSVYLGVDGVIPMKIRIRNFRIPSDGDVCVLFYGKKKCAEGRPLPPGERASAIPCHASTADPHRQRRTSSN
jgi:hypothetical protein